MRGSFNTSMDLYLPSSLAAPGALSNGNVPCRLVKERVMYPYLGEKWSHTHYFTSSLNVPASILTILVLPNITLLGDSVMWIASPTGTAPTWHVLGFRRIVWDGQLYYRHFVRAAPWLP